MGVQERYQQTWVLAKTYFKNLTTEKHTFQDNMSIRKCGFKSMNNVRESRSQGLPFDGRSLSGSTIGSMFSLGGSLGGQLVQEAAQRDEVWTEYVDML